jgi:tetratricopeptide (TPR) repeat protein
MTVIEMSNLGAVLLMERRYAKAEPLLRSAVRFLAAQPPSGNDSLARTQLALGRALLRQDRYREAEPYLTAGYAFFAKDPAQQPIQLREAREDLAELYRALHQTQKASEFKPVSERQ